MEAQREGLQCKVESDAVEGPVVKATKVLLAPSLRKEKGQLAAGMCLFRVIDREKNEARLPSSHDEGYLEVCPDRACMERTTGDFCGLVLEGSMVGRTEHEVRGKPVSMGRW